MQRVKVKICGIRTREEAQVALESGADALGFNFWAKSPRYIEPEAAREIIGSLPPLGTTVGVFVNEDAETINEIVAITGIQAVQLHGDEGPEFVNRLKQVKLIKALRVGEGFDVNRLRDFPASAFLLDAKVKDEYGGTGQRFDWRIAVEAKAIAPIILAGGLTVENVEEAIRYVGPYAVDVCSGVEAEPGKKDLEKMREFLATVGNLCN